MAKHWKPKAERDEPTRYSKEEAAEQFLGGPYPLEQIVQRDDEEDTWWMCEPTGELLLRSTTNLI